MIKTKHQGLSFVQIMSQFYFFSFSCYVKYSSIHTLAIHVSNQLSYIWGSVLIVSMDGGAFSAPKYQSLAIYLYCWTNTILKCADHEPGYLDHVYIEDAIQIHNLVVKMFQLEGKGCDPVAINHGSQYDQKSHYAFSFHEYKNQSEAAFLI